MTFVLSIALNQELIVICVAKTPLSNTSSYFFLFLQHEREQVMTTNVWLTQVRALAHILLTVPLILQKHCADLAFIFMAL